jgi:hypothetical protein
MPKRVLGELSDKKCVQVSCGQLHTVNHLFLIIISYVLLRMAQCILGEATKKVF